MGLFMVGCASPPRSDGVGQSGGTSNASDTGPTGPATAGNLTEGNLTDGSLTDGNSGLDTTADGGIKFDLGTTQDLGDEPPMSLCKVVDDMNAVGECGDEAPPDSFEPVIQWTFTPRGESESFVTPLVANLTDDNGDGAIDLCDVPDVVLVAGADVVTDELPGHIYVLDGATGALHFRIPTAILGSVTPAVADIDDDGIPEIVTVAPDGDFIVFEHDGALKWKQPGQSPWDANLGAVSIANLDNAGLPEIIFGNRFITGDGSDLVVLPDVVARWSATVAVDMDGDGDLEIVLGHAVYHHTGDLLWNTELTPGFPQVADLDGDLLPEVLLTHFNGLSLIEHDGVVTYTGLRPTGAPAESLNWQRPATVHDFDGDGSVEYATSSAGDYTVYRSDASMVWTAPVQDDSGIAAGTAFDFLGDGVAEAMYADEDNMFVFDGDGQVLLQVPRGSGTGTEYPVVADLDNDGSAEIAFVSNKDGAPTLQVVADVEDRWIQARRIWNQHAYHVTNVREDGTIPQFESPHWESLNTFRTNAQIEGGSVCIPPMPAG